MHARQPQGRAISSLGADRCSRGEPLCVSVAGGAHLEDFFRNLPQRRRHVVAVDVAVPLGMEENGGAPGISRCFGILPFVADHEAVLQVDVPLERGPPPQKRTIERWTECRRITCQYYSKYSSP